MTDGESFIVKRRDLPDLDQIILLENKDALAHFLDEQVTAIVEAITGALAAGPKSWAVTAGKLVQATLKAQLFQQLSREIQKLRDKGKIPADFAEKKNGFQSWVELMRIIDEESPDPERLDAIKAMFYAVNKVNATDGERIVAYQLFQITKKLTSGQLLYLKTCYEIHGTDKLIRGTENQSGWYTKVGKKLGHNVTSLMNLDDAALSDLGLLHRRGALDTGLNVLDARLTDLGIKFCEEIQKYHLEARSQSKSG